MRNPSEIFFMQFYRREYFDEVGEEEKNEGFRAIPARNIDPVHFDTNKSSALYQTISF